MAGRRKEPLPSDQERLLTVPEVAERLRVSEETVRRYLRSGRLQGMTLAGRSSGYRIEPAELRRFLEASRGTMPPPVTEGKVVRAAA